MVGSPTRALKKNYVFVLLQWEKKCQLTLIIIFYGLLDLGPTTLRPLAPALSRFFWQLNACYYYHFHQNKLIVPSCTSWVFNWLVWIFSIRQISIMVSFLIFFNVTNVGENLNPTSKKWAIGLTIEIRLFCYYVSLSSLI